MKKDNNKITIKNELTDFLLYTIPNNDIKVEAFLYNENIWLTQKRMAELFEVGKSTISEHLTNIFESKELDKNSVVRNFRTTAKDGAIAGKTTIEIIHKKALAEYKKFNKIQNIDSDFEKQIKKLKKK